MLLIFMLTAAVAGMGIVLRRGELRMPAFAARLSRLHEADTSARPGAPAALLLLATGLLAWTLWQIGGAAAAGLIRAPGGPQTAPAEPSLRAGAVAALGAYAAGFAGILAAWRLSRGPARATLAGLGFRPTLADPLWGVALLLLVYPLLHVISVAAQFISRWITGATPDAMAHATLQRLFGPDVPRDMWWWLTVLSAALLAPVFEEVIYRGCIQTGLGRGFWPADTTRADSRRRAVAVWGGIVLSAGLFAVVHAGAAAPHALPTLFAFGIALGIVYERSGRLGPPVALHMAFNILNLVLASRMSA